MVTAHFVFLAILGRFWGLKNWFLAHIYNSTPPKCKIISKNLIYHYKLSSLAFLEKKNYCFKYHPCAIFASCITFSPYFWTPKCQLARGLRKFSFRL